MRSEKDVKAAVKKLCDEYGAYYAMPQTGGYGRSGVPDFLICAGGHFFGVETKFGNNRATALQQREIDAINQARGTAFVVTERPAHLQYLESVLEYHTRGHRQDVAHTPE